MGNAVPRSMCHEATPKARAAEASRSGAVPSGRACSAARRHGGKVARAAGGRRGAEEQQVGGRGRGGGSTVVMTVKVVVTRKEAEKLIARLEEQSARERKARIAELTGQLRSGDGGGGRSPATCGPAWAPRLAAIHES